MKDTLFFTKFDTNKQHADELKFRSLVFAYTQVSVPDEGNSLGFCLTNRNFVANLASFLGERTDNPVCAKL
jgi:hypothetical protein